MIAMEKSIEVLLTFTQPPVTDVPAARCSPHGGRKDARHTRLYPDGAGLSLSHTQTQVLASLTRAHMHTLLYPDGAGVSLSLCLSRDGNGWVVM
jgi:hypothetical protein